MAADLDPDRDLMAAVRSGPDRERAFHELYRRYWRALDEFFRRRGYTPEERQDLIQETFSRGFRGVEAIRIPFRFWLFLMARHVFRDDVRKRGTRIPDGKTATLDAIAELHAAGGDSQKEMLTQERREVLHQALRALPPKMRQALEMRARGDKIDEIALAMKITPGAVKAHLYQGRQRLKETLAPYFEEPEEDARREYEEEADDH